MKTFRVIDTGLREGRRQMAFDQAMIDARKNRRIPDTIRFLRFPAAALVGRHQALAQEIKLDYCPATGFGSCAGSPAVACSTRRGAASAGSSCSTARHSASPRSAISPERYARRRRRSTQLGIDATYRPRNDIEVDGRKITAPAASSTDHDLLPRYDPRRHGPRGHGRALNIPAAKLAKRALEFGRTAGRHAEGVA